MAFVFGRDQFVRRRKGTPCPKFVWVLIIFANVSRERWEPLPRTKHLRTIARSPTPFKLKNHDLKQALESLGLEWLTPSQIDRIRQCPAPRRKTPRQRFDRLFGVWGVDPRSPVGGPKCNQFFWAWRRDQKTCDLHLRYASLLRVEKHRKAKQNRKRKGRQLKEARQQLRRVRRANKQAEKLAQVSPVLAVTPSELQAQNDLADFRILQLIRHGLVQTFSQTEFQRLGAMIRGGYIEPHKAELQTYRLSGEGLQLLGQLRRRVSRAPEDGKSSI